MALFASLAGVAEARLRRVARRTRWKAAMLALCGLLALLAFGFLLLAVTVALADSLGLVRALLVMAVITMVCLGIVIAVLASENRKEQRLAARRQGLDRQFARAAVLSAVPSRRSRGTLGLGLVALGALLFLRDRD